MNDLDWLARNVHEWPAGDNGKIQRNYESPVGYDFDSFGIACKYSKDQWQTRRAELQGKPSWDDAPEWAEWLAQCSDGEWRWFEDYPYQNNSVWSSIINGTWTWTVPRGLVLGDWRNTLERKPSEKTTKALDEAEGIESAIDQLMQDAYKNKPVRKLVSNWTGPEDGLPPVGTDVEYKVNNDTEWDSGCILAINGTWAWILEYSDMEPCTFDMTCTVFRPLRTEEDKSVEEMLNIAEDFHPLSGDEYLLCKDIFTELVRMGYRKLDTPTDND